MPSRHSHRPRTDPWPTEGLAVDLLPHDLIRLFFAATTWRLDYLTPMAEAFGPEIHKIQGLDPPPTTGLSWQKSQSQELSFLQTAWMAGWEQARRRVLEVGQAARLAPPPRCDRPTLLPGPGRA